MAGPSASTIVFDTAGNAAPQFWDDVLDEYAYAAGSVYDSGNKVGELFARQAPIVPYGIGAYAAHATVKSSAGTFFGAYGQYKGSVNAWIMIFDASSAPTTGATPLAAIAVAPIGAIDNNWSMQPGKPYTFSTGLYVALSSTGGTFTASSNTDLTGTIEYL